MRDDLPPPPATAILADEDVPVEPAPDHQRLERARRPWYVGPVLAIFAVTAFAGALRFYKLSFPSEYVFDEVYYAKDGCLYAGYPYKECNLERDEPQTGGVHPPLGNWLIAAGEKVWGNRAFGWRVSAAAFGTLTVFMVGLLAYRLWASALWAAVAGLLIGAEHLNFVQSRISMLDIFLAAFVVMGFLFLVLDRHWIERVTPPPEPLRDPTVEIDMDLPADRPPSPIFRPWRLAAGLAFGAAVATKWSGGTALVAAIVLSLAWERTRRAQQRLPGPFWEAFRDEGFGIFLFLVIVPIGVYFASYFQWFAEHGFAFGDWWNLQRAMADFGLNLSAEHPYASSPWTWLLLLRPVAYYYKGNADAGTSAEILGIGNPIIFWTSLMTIPYTAFAWARKRDWRAGMIFCAFAFQYFAWFLASRTSFLFYMTPITPFMALALTYSVRDLSEVRLGRNRRRVLAWAAALLVVLAVAVFVFYLPVLTGRTIPTSQWQWRVPFPRWV